MLGLSDAAFWQLSLSLFERLLDVYQAQQRRADLRAGLIAAEIRNTLRSSDTDRVWEAEDFYPKPAEPMTDDEMYESMTLWAAATEHRKAE